MSAQSNSFDNAPLRSAVSTEFSRSPTPLTTQCAWLRLAPNSFTNIRFAKDFVCPSDVNEKVSPVERNEDENGGKGEGEQPNSSISNGASLTPSASAYGVQSLTFASGYGSLQMCLQCSTCSGTGFVKYDPIVCDKCHGKKCIFCNSRGLMKMPWDTCEQCHGSGETPTTMRSAM